MRRERERTTKITLAASAAAMLLALLWIAAPAPAEQSGEDAPRSARGADAAQGDAARAEIRPIDGGDVRGTITLERVEGDLVRVSGVVRGLSPGKHGFHVHEGTSCDRRGGHFAPTGDAHGSPDAQQRHVGDLGNLAANQDGEAAYLRIDRALALSGPDSVVGHVLVVHQGEDDYLSQPSGDSGKEIACGVIERARGDAAHGAQDESTPAG